MATNIKGITIQLGADATRLTSAMRDIDSNLSKTQKSLNEVNKSLKFDPNNTVLLAQKQELLTRKIEDTKQKVATLKDTLSTMEANGVSKTSDEFMKVEREIVATESKLKTFNNELKQVSNQNSNLGQLGAKFSDVGNKLTAAGQAMRAVSVAAAAVSAAINAAAVSAGVWADDLNTASSVTGIATGDLQKYAAAAELVDVSAETIGKSMARMKKNMLSAAEGTGTAADTFAQLGVSITNSDGSLRDQNAVFNETIKKLGEMENETERDALAMTIFGKSAAQLNPMIEDMGETYATAVEFMSKHNIPIVDQETLDQANRFNDAIDNIKMVFSQAVMVIGSKLAGYLAPLMENVADKLAAIAGWIANLNPRILAVVSAVASLVGVVAPLLIGLGAMSKVVGKILPNMNGILKLLGPIKTALAPIISFCAANPLLLVVGALAALAVGLQVTGTDVDKFCKKITSFVTNALNALIQSLPRIIETAGQMVTSLITGIVNNMPAIIDTMVQLIMTICNTIITNLPQILQMGVRLIVTLANAIINNLPKIIQSAVRIVTSLLSSITSNLPKIIQMGVTLIGKLVSGLIQAIPTLVSNAPKIIAGIVRGLMAGVGELASVGVNLIKGLWSGAGDMVDWVVDKFKSLGKKILKGIKSALGIKSPSKEFAKVGMYSMLGLTEGIEDNLGKVQKAMDDVSGTMLGTDLSVQANMNNNAAIGDSVANALNTSLALANSGSATPTQVNIVVELGGAKVAEQIYKLNKQGALALQG